MTAAGYKMCHDCIWTRISRKSYKILDETCDVLNLWNQTCILPYGTWIGIGVSAMGHIEGKINIQNFFGISEYIR